MPSTTGYDAVEPIVSRRDNGGWMAVSPPDAPIHIGVAAWSADDARSRFACELRAWRLLLDERTENHDMTVKQPIDKR